MELTKNQVKDFQAIIYNYFNLFGRPFSWRDTTTPYNIFVSEVMLQQTQTARVKPKYEAFITTFPDFATLANAPLYDLLQAWQGLGYNRRALSLQKSAQIIGGEYKGVMPHDPEELIKLPGIGKATAASIAAFAFNSPTVFVETNIRVVFIHTFFQNRDNPVTDGEILELVAQTIDTKNARTWYYALMDYGVMLKAQGINPINKSKHYHKQSKFKGSDRQIRGAILKLLIKDKQQTIAAISKTLTETLNAKQPRVERIVAQLLDEKFIEKTDDTLSILT